MRVRGSAFGDKGFFELDLESGLVAWTNPFTLSKLGMKLEQVQSFTMYDIVPEEFHDALSSFIADAKRGRASRFYIWPFRTATGDVSWWYFALVETAHPVHWFKAEFLNLTKKSGPEFSSMHAAMNTANSYNDLVNKLTDFQEFTTGSMEAINRKYDELKAEQEELREHVVGAVNAATKAANAAMEMSASMKTFKTEVQDQLANQTTQILQLIGTDTVHDRRIAAFEAYMRQATETAMKEITDQANQAGAQITIQANRAGKGLSRRVTIPVGAIAAIATILQWIINHWPK